MKKWMGILLAAVALTGMAGCDGGTDGPTTPQTAEVNFLDPKTPWGVDAQYMAQDNVRLTEILDTFDDGTRTDVTAAGGLDVLTYTYHYNAYAQLIRATALFEGSFRAAIEKKMDGAYTIKEPDFWTSKDGETNVELTVEDDGKVLLTYTPVREMSEVSCQYTEPYLNWDATIAEVQENSPGTYLATEGQYMYFSGTGTVLEYGYRFATGTNGAAMNTAMAVSKAMYVAAMRTALTDTLGYEYGGKLDMGGERGQCDVFVNEANNVRAYLWIRSMTSNGQTIYEVIAEYVPETVG